MNIKIFVSQAGRIILTSDTYFKEPIEAVLFDYDSRRVSLKFQDDALPYTLNCEVDDYVVNAMAQKDVCGFGFERNGKLEYAAYLPLHFAQRDIALSQIELAAGEQYVGT